MSSEDRPQAVPVAPAPACRSACRPVALVAGGRLFGLTGAQGTLPCACCRAAARWDTRGPRLTAPRRPESGRRVGGRAGRLAAITWREALDRLAQAVGGGGRRLVLLHGGPLARARDGLVRRVAAFLDGSVDVVRPAEPGQRVARLLPRDAGGPTGSGRPGWVLAWGTDPVGRGLPDSCRLARAVGEGAALLAIDPRASATAAAAERHLAPLPGTDAALALGLAGLLPGGEAEAGAWPPGRVAAVTGVTEQELRRLAAALVRPGGLVLVGAGLGRGAAVEAAVGAVARLARVAGAPLAGPGRTGRPDLLLPAPVGAPVPQHHDAAAFVARLAEREPDRDVVIVDGPDPLATWPGASHLARYLESASFVVRLTTDESGPSASRADLLLPVAGPFEAADAVAGPGGPEPWIGRAALSPPGEALPHARIWRALAARLGWPADWFPDDLGPRLAEAGPMPPPQVPGEAAPPGPGPAGSERQRAPLADRSAWPLELVAGPPAPGAPPTIAVAPEDARERGLDDGDPVVIQNDRGALRGRVAVSPRQRPGLLSAPLWCGRGEAGLGPLLDARAEEPVPGAVLVELSAGSAGRGWEGPVRFSTA